MSATSKYFAKTAAKRRRAGEQDFDSHLDEEMVIRNESGNNKHNLFIDWIERNK